MKKTSRNYTLCEVRGSPVRRYGNTPKSLRPFPITAQRFAAARAGCFLTIEQTAKFVGRKKFCALPVGILCNWRRKYYAILNSRRTLCAA